MNMRPLFSIGEESDASDEGLLKNGDATSVKYEDKNSNLRLNYALAFLLGAFATLMLGFSLNHGSRILTMVTKSKR